MSTVGFAQVNRLRCERPRLALLDTPTTPANTHGLVLLGHSLK